MIDVLLIQPPIQDFYLTRKRTIPYGLACIAGALIRNGFSVEILDALATNKSHIIEWPAEMVYLQRYYGQPDCSPLALFHHFRHYGYSWEHIANVVRWTRPFVVGISSLFTAYSQQAIHTAQLVKAVNPNCHVVLGGHHPTALPQEVMANAAVDYCLRGEGEEALPALVKALKQKKSPAQVPGIVLRQADGTISRSAPALANLVKAPPPAIQLLNNRFYRRQGQATMVITASRGCPLRCSYCALSAGSAIRYRRRPVALVIEEIEEFARQRPLGFIDFEDENISLDRQWFGYLLDEIRHRFAGKIELRAMNGLLPTTLDAEIIGAMYQAGFRALNLSLVTTARGRLADFGRPDCKASFAQAVAIADGLGLESVGYIIIGAPGQTPAESLADLLFVAATGALVGVSVYYPAPGSADFERDDQRGLLPPDFSLMRSSAMPISDTTSRNQVVTLLRLARVANFLKALAQEDSPVPTPKIFTGKRLDITDKRQLGYTLISWFLADGILRGVTPEGEIYSHDSDAALCRNFVTEISKPPSVPK